MYTLSNDSTGLPIKFEGTLIGHASSKDARNPDPLRWSEISVYRTEDGVWIVHKQGISRVYHTVDSTCSRQAQPISASDLAETDRSCPICKPTDYPRLTVLKEKNRSYVRVADTPDALLASLMMRDKDRVLVLPRIAANALREAQTRDDQLRTITEVTVR